MTGHQQFIKFLLIVFFFTGPIRYLHAQEQSLIQPKQLTRILFVFDASQSMSGTWESDEKINIARQILVDLVDSLENIDNIEMALRVYGHQSPVPPQDCSDTRLEVPFAPNNASRIRTKLRDISPRGTTPIASSLAMTIDDFPATGNCRNIIILITDGIEACDGDPCLVSLDLQKKGIILKPFVIGIGLDPGFRETFECVGNYYNAVNENKFKETLGFVINQVLNSTSAQVNLLNEDGLPLETDVNMTFSDHYTGRVINNFFHTMNPLGNPDTINLDHLITYRLRINTIPPIELDSIVITPGKHTTITIPAPQGFLRVKTSNGNGYLGLPFNVRENGSPITIHNQRVGEIEKYLKGKYEIELPTIPRIIEDIEILQSHTTIIDIPEPGEVTFTSKLSGFGSIYQVKNSNQQTWLLNLNPSVLKEKHYFLPGDYLVVFRPASTKSSLNTNTIQFKVRSGVKTFIDLY